MVLESKRVDDRNADRWLWEGRQAGSIETYSVEIYTIKWEYISNKREPRTRNNAQCQKKFDVWVIIKESAESDFGVWERIHCKILGSGKSSKERMYPFIRTGYVSYLALSDPDHWRSGTHERRSWKSNVTAQLIFTIEIAGQAVIWCMVPKIPKQGNSGISLQSQAVGRTCSLLESAFREVDSGPAILSSSSCESNFDHRIIGNPKREQNDIRVRFLLSFSEFLIPWDRWAVKLAW